MLLVEARMLGARTVSYIPRHRHFTFFGGFPALCSRACHPHRRNRASFQGLTTATTFTDASNCGTMPFTEIPAPPMLPFVGSLWDYVFGKGEHFTMSHEVQLERCRKYGKIYRERFGSTNFVFIADPNAIERVMRAETAFPRKPAVKAWIEARIGLGYKGGILSDDMQEWKRFRTPLNKLALQPKRLHTNFTQGINEIMSDYVEYLAGARCQSQGSEQYCIADMQTEARKLSLEAIGLVVYGKRLNTMTKEVRPEIATFIQSILDVFEVFTELRMTYPFHRLIGSQAWHKNLEGWKKNFEYNSELVTELQERLMARMNGQADDTEGNYYVTSLLEQLLSDSQQSVQEIILTAMDMFSAGMETVSSALTWTLHHLAKHPEIQDRIFQESVSILGNDRLHATPSELQDMTLTKNVIKESLRLASVFPSNFRILDTDIDLLGYRIPAEIPIGFCHYYINRSPEYFHEPEKFNPDRWWRDSNNISPFAAIPFGFGARMCPGRRVAELELLVALHWICRRFRLESVVTTEVKQKLNAMLVPDGPLPIRFLDRC